MSVTKNKTNVKTKGVKYKVDSVSVDLTNIEKIEQDLKDHLSTRKDLIIDLLRVEHLDSIGLTSFFHLHNIVQESGYELTFINVRPHIYDLIHTWKLDAILHLKKLSRKTVKPTVNASVYDPVILIADDVPINIKLIERFMIQESYSKVYTATNGAEAIHTASRIEAEFIFLDIYMPYMNGLQALPIIRNNHPKSVIVMMSADHDELKDSSDIENYADSILIKDGKCLGRRSVDIINAYAI
ncbi:MAG: response regulator [Planctomycetes bacterium]|nr:response regulator [Planctomycetota bacterium]